MNITPTIGLFFSFVELKGADKGSWVSINVLPEKSFLHAFTINYNSFKDKFLYAKCGNRCPKVMYVMDRGHRFPVY